MPAPARAWDWAKDFFVATAADGVFVLCLGWIGQAALTATPPAAAAADRVGVFRRLLRAGGDVRALLSVPVFGYFHSPLTYQLLYLAGDVRDVRSSLWAFVTPASVVGLLGGTLLYALLARFTSRRVGLPRRARDDRRAGAGGRRRRGECAYARKRSDPWRYRPDHRIAENPHWCGGFVLPRDDRLASVRLATAFPPECSGDFQTVREPPRRGRYRLGTPPANVILFVLESTATQHLGLYGSPYDTTPNLQREAANAVVFDNFYAHVGHTASSLVALTLSSYPAISWRQLTKEQPDLPGVSLAQVLKARLPHRLPHRGRHRLRGPRQIPRQPRVRRRRRPA